MSQAKVTIPSLYQKKTKGEKVTMLTAYDYPTAVALEEAGVDVALVGDSLGNVVLGYDSTVPVTMDEMIHHAKAARRGVKNAMLIGDMPFMSYQVSTQEAVFNAGRFMKEAGCDMVKLEGGVEMAPTIRAIVNAGIPVCAHIGLTPQSVSKLGGFRVQGKDIKSAQAQIDATHALEEAGADMIVLECVPSLLAAEITKITTMITIGIGAGPDTDGQVLVIHDLVGLFDRMMPKMAKRYAHLLPLMRAAMTEYADEVKSGAFPAEEHGFAMDPEVLKQLKL